MGSGQHQHIRSVLCVDHAVRKALEPAAADLGCERMPRRWKLVNQFDDLQRFDQKRITKSWRLIRIPANSLVKLGLRRFQQANAHAVIELT